MATDRQIRAALTRKLLGKVDFEDPKRCEVHAHILSKLPRWSAPKRASGWPSKASALRKRLLDEVYLKGLPKSVTDAPPNAVWGKTIRAGKGYRIRKVRYEGYPGMWIPALLYEPTRMRGRVPVVLNPNGHHAGGKAMDYKQARCINLAKRGMIALNTEFVGMGELTADRDHQRIGCLDLCGIAGVSVFYLAMKRGLDLLLEHPNADPERVAMTGLSGGGWQTAVLSAIDTRITTIIPVAGHSPVWQRVNCVSDIGDLEQNPTDLCAVADYDLMTALFAPRPTLLIYNLRDDCCFRSRRTYRSVYQPVKPLYERLKAGDDFQFYENRDPGTHNYEADSRNRLYRFLDQEFGLNTPAEEHPFEDELLSERDLNVGLPANNATMQSLALDEARTITHGPVRNAKAIRAKRKEIAETIRVRRAKRVRAERAGEKGDLRQLRLKLDDAWTVPVTQRGGRGIPTLVIAHGGRAGSFTPATRVEGPWLAADVYGTGESWCPANYHMSLGVTGERPLGIMVGQILDLAAWAGKSKGVHLDATGNVVSVAALCAAALEPALFASLRVNSSVDSLRRAIDLPLSYHDHAPLFCFGLLKTTDIPQLIDLAEGTPIEWVNRGPVYSAKEAANAG